MFSPIQSAIILKLQICLVVPANVRSKRSKMMRGLSVKNVVLFKKSAGKQQNGIENKEGYIHGFTENYVKVKAP
jgi:threonylcarbamoyladenosine tRNA methylthiotransferase MtaB